MRLSRAAILVVLASASCAIPVDTESAAAIPAAVAVASLQELLPAAAFVNCYEPSVGIMQSEVLSWTVDREGVEFRTKRAEPFRLLWSGCRGAEISKVLFSYEVRVYMATATNPRKCLFRFNWKEEAPARRAAELFEALRGDR